MFGQRDFRGGQAPFFLGHEHARNPGAQRVAARQQRRRAGEQVGEGE